MPRPPIPENTSIWLDAVRGISAQIVVISHTFQIFFSGEGAFPGGLFGNASYAALVTLAPLAQQAVVAFFVISGWLVGGNVLRDVVGRQFSFKKFTINRVTRLWIVLIPALLLTAALDQVAIHFGAGASIIASRAPFYPPWWFEVDPWSLKTFLSNSLFLQTITSWQLGTNLSLWSLSNEFWYYFLFPSILGICLVSDKKIRWICLFAVVAIVGLFLSSGIQRPSMPVSYFFYFQIWGLAAIAAWLPRKAAIVGIGVAALLLIVAVAATGSFTPAFVSDLYTAVIVLVILLLGGSVPVYWALEPARFFSSYSYSLYVVHLPVLVFLMSFDPLLLNRIPFSFAALVRFFVYVLIANLVGVVFSLATERNTGRLRLVISRIVGRERLFNR